MLSGQDRVRVLTSPFQPMVTGVAFWLAVSFVFAYPVVFAAVSAGLVTGQFITLVVLIHAVVLVAGHGHRPRPS